MSDVPGDGAAGALTRLVNRRVGSLTGDVGRAASATQAFLVFALALTGAYTVFFAVYDVEGLGPVVVSGVIATVAFAVGIAVVRSGHQLTASIIAITVGTAQLSVVTAFVGWIVGLQLFLIAGGQLVFMVFTERQRVLRWVYLAFAIVAFFYCQLVVPERGEGFAFPTSVSGVLFSINATITLVLMYALAAISHYGAARARAEAHGAAALAEYLANTDELTGLSNRRPVLKRLDALSATEPYALAIADVDHFKRLNDTFGHECGDRVLAQVGERLHDGLRAGDSVGRWGGEEFIFVMAATTIEDAVATMERMREGLAEPFACAGHSHELTVSVGVTDAQPDGMAHRALQRADAALYDAKAAGRNMVCAVPGPAAQPPAPRRRRT